MKKPPTTLVDVALMMRRGALASATQCLLADAHSQRTGAELASNVSALAAHFLESGLSQGEPVVISLGSRVETIETYWAVIEAGGIPVPVILEGEEGRFPLAEIAEATGACRAVLEAGRVPDAEAAGIKRGIVYGAQNTFRADSTWINYAQALTSTACSDPVIGEDYGLCAYTPVQRNGSFVLARRLHRSAGLAGAVSLFLNGAANHRVVMALPLVGAALEATIASALYCGSPVRLVDPDNIADMASAASWRPTSVMSTDQTARAVLNSTIEIAPQGAVDPMSWIVVEDLSAMKERATPLASMEGVRTRRIAADDRAGFLFEYFPTRGEWQPLPTVGVAAETDHGPNGASGSVGALLIRAPALCDGYIERGPTQDDFAYGWYRAGIEACLGESGFTITGSARLHSAPTANKLPLARALKKAHLMDVGRMMRRGTRFHGERTFMVSGSKRITFAATQRRVDALSTALRKQYNIQPGSRVAVLMHNRSEWVESYLAVVQLGAIIVPMNFRLGAGELSHILNNSGACLLIAEEEYSPLFSKICSLTPSLLDIVTLYKDENTNSLGEGVEGNRYEQLIEAHKGAGSPALPNIEDTDPCSLLYTAGTTGKPKGAVRTHKGIMWFSFTTCIYGLRMMAEGSYLATPPMFHIAGHETSIFTCIMRGLKAVTLDQFDPGRVLEVVETEKITSMFIPPTMGLKIVDEILVSERDLRSLRDWSSASAPLPEPLRDEVLRLLPWIRLRNSYGMTETGGIAAADGDAAVSKPSSCVGRISPTAEVQLVDDCGTRVTDGQTGEITLRSPQMLTEYWNNEDTTRVAFSGGWFHTGDLGRLDHDGHLHILGRLKDMIITGGENVYAVEVENVLAAIPEIVEASVVGIPDVKWGEAVAAAIVLKAGCQISSAEIITYCRAHIAHYKCPKHIFVVDNLPRNAAGKILKNELQLGISKNHLTPAIGS